MTDELLDRLVAAAASPDPATLVALDLHGADHDLLEEIMSTPVDEQTEPAPRGAPAPAPTVPTVPADRWERRRRRLHAAVAVAAALAVAVVIGLAVVLPPLVSPEEATSGSTATGGTSATTARFTLAARQVAEANPRLLVDAPGWRISHVDEFDSTQGEMSFTRGAAELQVSWRRADQYATYVADRADVGRARAVSVLGQPGRMYAYSPQDFTVILPVQGAVFLELRGGVGDRPAFLRLLDRLRAVDVDTWLSALPASVVKAEDQERVAEQMLSDVPLPPRLDTSRLSDGDTSDYYHVGARVTGLVTCAWVADWSDARTSGNREEMRRAAAALSSSHRWDVLRRMDAEGDWPEVVWEIADEVAAGSLPREYRQGLGCDD